MEDLKHEQEQKTESAQTQESAHSEPVALNMDALKHQATQNTANAKTNDEWQKELNDKDAALKAEQEKSLRARAELDNFRKRKDQEVEQFKKYAAEKTIKDLLTVLDSFDRACDPQIHYEKVDSVVEGMRLIQKQFHGLFERWGVKAIDCVNTKFDPNFHQAVLQEPNNTVPPETVIREMQKGYTLHEKVIRPSMVVLAEATSSSAPPSVAAQTETTTTIQEG